MKNILITLLIYTLLVPVMPLQAYANDKFDLHDTCDPYFNGNAKGDAQLNFCTQARVSLTKRNNERVKTGIYTLAAGLTLAAIPFPPLHPACKAIGTVASLGATASDIVTSISLKDISSQFMSSISSLASGFMGSEMLGSIAKGLGIKVAGEAAKTLECVSTSVVMAGNAMMARSGWTANGAAFHSSLQSAQSIDTSNVAVLHYGGGGNLNQPAPTGNGNAGNLNSGGSGSEDPCAAHASDAYLECAKKNIPEVAALTNNPTFMNAAKTALGNQHLGDFLKNFPADSPQAAASYTANALGSSKGESLSKLLEEGAKLANKGESNPNNTMAYSRKPGSSGSNSDLDFSKMMSDMLKKLNPDDPNGTQAQKDPSEVVFRRLDLLPPEKIEQNKDISLFVRVGYRYRKNMDNVDQLNPSSGQ